MESSGILPFRALGCAISSASAALMTEALKGKPVTEVEHLFEGLSQRRHHRLRMSARTGASSACWPGVRDYPSRVKCATLAWHAVRAALERHAEPVATE